MKLFKDIKNKLIGKRENGNTVDLGGLRDFFRDYGLNVEDPESSSEFSEIIYFICMKHLSGTISKMPWGKMVITEKKGREKVFDKEFDLLLNIRPNPYLTASTFWSSVELNRLHFGNAYVYIETFKGKPKHLWLLPSQEVQIWVDNAGIFKERDAIWYVWMDSKSGKSYRFFQDEVMHFKTDISLDGITGIAIKEILKTQINSGKSSASFLNRLYKNNMFGSKVIVYYTGEVSNANQKKIAESLEQFSTRTDSGKFIPMPAGTQAQLLDMKLADAQFFENNKVSALQLAAAFGIKPNVINDYTKSSYSNSETQQIDFYVNTLQPLFKAYEQELTYKLLTEEELKGGYRLEINEKILFKMDSKTQAEVYGKYLSNFGMTPNEVREELNLPYVEGGDELIGNGNAINLENVGTQYMKGGE